jgi:hypothetical protein
MAIAPSLCAPAWCTSIDNGLSASENDIPFFDAKRPERVGGAVVSSLISANVTCARIGGATQSKAHWSGVFRQAHPSRQTRN